MNQPYRKQLDSAGVLLNPIEINNPYLNNYINRSQRREQDKYIWLNGVKIKVGGNNRKPCKRTGKSRMQHLMN